MPDNPLRDFYAVYSAAYKYRNIGLVFGGGFRISPIS